MKDRACTVSSTMRTTVEARSIYDARLSDEEVRERQRQRDPTLKDG